MELKRPNRTGRTPCSFCFLVPFCSPVKPMICHGKLPNRCRTRLVHPCSSSGRHWVSDWDLCPSQSTEPACTQFCGALEKGRAENSTAVQPAPIQPFFPWSPEHFNDRHSPSSSQGALPALYCCHYQKSRTFCWNCSERVREPGTNVLTVVFLLHRAAMCSVFPGYVFFLLPVLPGRSRGLSTPTQDSQMSSSQPASSNCWTLEILDLHTQGSILHRVCDTGRLEPALCYKRPNWLHTQVGCFLKALHSPHQ